MSSENTFQLKLDRPDFTVLLEEHRKLRELTDVDLQIGDKLFPAHRIILSLNSPVLKAMLSDQWSTSKTCPISSEYVDLSIVEELLHFLYTGSIDLTPDNVHPVCVAAHFLQIADLLDEIVQHLVELITVENVLPLLEFSLTREELEQYRDSGLRFIAKNNHQVFQDPRILEFTSENFKDLILGLKEQLWDPRTELRVNTFDCIVRWMEANLGSLDQLPGLLKSIPLEELPHNFLTGTVSTHPLVKGSTSGSGAVSAALENYQAVQKAGWRLSHNLLGLGGRSKPIGKIHCYDMLTESWNSLPGNHFNRGCTEFAAIINRHDIVVSGGSYSVEMFVWATKTWRKLTDLPRPTSGLELNYAIGSLNDQLYASGYGWDTANYRNRTTTLLRYCFETDQWEPLASLNIARYGHRLLSHGDYLYAAGDSDGIVEKYDPMLDQWTVIGGEQCNRTANQQSCEHLGKIYVLGLSNKLNVLDLETGLWDSITVKKNRYGRLFSMNGRLLSLGGGDHISEFNFETLEWEDYLKIDPSMISCCLIAGEFY